MKPVIRSWPYLAFVVALYSGWLALAKLPMPAADLQNLLGLYGGGFGLFAVAGAGAVLGHRRGYDWVCVLACLLTFVVIAILGDLIVLGQPPAWTGIGIAVLAYTVIGHIGIGAALGVAKLDSPKKSK